MDELKEDLTKIIEEYKTKLSQLRTIETKIVSEIEDDPSNKDNAKKIVKLEKLAKEITKIEQKLKEQITYLQARTVGNLQTQPEGTQKRYANRFTSNFGFSPVYNPYFSPSNSDTNSCSLGDVWYGNKDLEEDVELLLGNRKLEGKEFINEEDANKLQVINKREQILKHGKLIVNTIVFFADLDLKLGSIPQLVDKYNEVKTHVHDNKNLNNMFSSLNKRLIYVLNVLSEIDITMELYKRFLNHVKNNYISDKEKNIYTFFYNKAKKAYDNVLISIYDDLGFDFEEDEIYDLDKFFAREHPNKLQKIFDSTLGKLLKTKNKDDRINKYAMERLYLLTVNIDQIHANMIPHINTIEYTISRLELLIDKTKCNYTHQLDYNPPMKRLLFKLIEFVKKDVDTKNNLVKETKKKSFSKKFGSLLEKGLHIIGNKI